MILQVFKHQRTSEVCSIKVEEELKEKKGTSETT